MKLLPSFTWQNKKGIHCLIDTGALGLLYLTQACGLIDEDRRRFLLELLYSTTGIPSVVKPDLSGSFENQTGSIV